MAARPTGRFLGIPYDWRVPAPARTKARWWNPEDRRTGWAPPSVGSYGRVRSLTSIVLPAPFSATPHASGRRWRAPHLDREAAHPRRGRAVPDDFDPNAAAELARLLGRDAPDPSACDQRSARRAQATAQPPL
jgi:hypothetical protein